MTWVILLFIGQLSRYASEDSFDSVIWSDSEEEMEEEDERNEMIVKTSKW